MKVLIIYATKNGASREAAQMLTDALGKRVDVSLVDVNDTLPSPSDFDVAIVGGSIRMGKLNSKLKKYIKENKDILSNMQSAAFICCGIGRDFDDYRIMQLPKDVSFSLGVHHFGGQLKPDRIKGKLDKIIVKAMRENILTQDPGISNSDRSDLPELMPDMIRALAARILNLI